MDHDTDNNGWSGGFQQHFQGWCGKIKNNLSNLNDWLQFLCTLWAGCALGACLWWIVQQGLRCLRLVWSSGHILKPLWARSWCLIWKIILFACAPVPYSYSLYAQIFFKMTGKNQISRIIFLIFLKNLKVILAWSFLWNRDTVLHPLQKKKQKQFSSSN